MFTPSLTIAIPVFERVEYFHRAINSALNQECPCEVIVIDNGSSHREFEKICSGYGNRIKYFRNETNIGMFANWNRCFEESQSDFVLILGDDDLVHPSFSRIFHDKLKQDPDIDIFYTDIHVLEMDGYYASKPGFQYPLGSNSGIDILRYAARYGLGCPTISMAIRREKFSGYYAGLTASNDWYWLYKNAIHFKFYGAIEKLIAYRKHSGSDSRNNSRLYLFSHAGIYLEIEKLLCNFADEAEMARERAAQIYNILLGDPKSWELITNYYLQDPKNPYTKLFDESGRFSESVVKDWAQKTVPLFRRFVKKIHHKLESLSGIDRCAVPEWVSFLDKTTQKNMSHL